MGRQNTSFHSVKTAALRGELEKLGNIDNISMWRPEVGGADADGIIFRILFL